VQLLISRLKEVSSVRLAFFGSLLLSLISVLGTVVIGRDAALYLDIAQRASEQGPLLAIQLFDWPWFSLLLAGTHLLLRLPMELCAHLWCALFMAGTCALLVDCVRQRVPAASYWACLVVLAMPAFNQYRYDILREFGFWFFSILTLWLALRWHVRGGWWGAALIHVALFAAVLFRLEAVLLMPALALWQSSGLRTRAGWGRMLQLNALPLLGGVLGLLAVAVLGGLSSVRIEYYLSMLDPKRVFTSFRVLSDQFAGTLINKYSKDEAGRIIFFGLLAALLIQFIQALGPFAVPFLYRRSGAAVRSYWREFCPFAWAALLYLVVLMLFFVRQQFMIPRYVSFLNILVVPLAAVVLMSLSENSPRTTRALTVIALLVMLHNVISLGAQKTQYIDAGDWVAKHVEPGASVYYDDERIAYYAGRGYRVPGITREAAMSPEHYGRYRYFLIDAHGDEPWLQDWLVPQHKRILTRFANRRGDSVLVIGD
jgi:uncharacterized Tic20 family protein